jgi:hypothetical protein
MNAAPDKGLFHVYAARFQEMTLNAAQLQQLGRFFAETAEPTVPEQISVSGWRRNDAQRFSRGGLAIEKA